MIIDSNAYIGHWPFRPLRHNTVDGLVELMDDKGIDVAVVSSINSIFYKNTQAGNEELAKDVKKYPERFIPLAVLNPMYPGWDYDLQESVEVLGMKGLRLFPYYHGYRLTDSQALNLIEKAMTFNLPIFLPMRVVDIRQRHWLDATENLDFSQIERVAQIFGNDVTLVVQEGIYPVGRGYLLGNEEAKNRRVFYEFSRMTSVLHKDLARLTDVVGAERLLFGTGIPFKYPDPVLLKLDLLGLDEESKKRVLYKNIKDVFGFEID